MFKAVLFDMDGVVIDTEREVTAFWTALADRHGIPLSDEIFDRHILGSPSYYTLQHVFPGLSETEQQAVHQDLERSETRQTYTPVKGVVELLRALAEGGVPTALVTSGMRWKVDAVAEQLGLAGLFTVEVIGSDITHGKPDPECYRLAVGRLDVLPDQCIVFEDSINGMKAAVAAGTCGVGVRPVGRSAVLVETGARYVIPDFSNAAIETGIDGLLLRLNADTCLPLTAASYQGSTLSRPQP
jgi:HAD superfamily hydrolase (TIGR01509 family)